MSLNVFIDTQVYYKLSFDFNGRLLKRLEHIASQSIIHLYITDIVKCEVEKNITECFRESLKLINNVKKKARILKNLDNPVLMNLFDKNFLNKADGILLKQFEEFIKTTKMKILSSENVSIKEIFDNYFKVKPPFGTGEKKCEFPDAFSIAALEKYCKNIDQKMYIISDDRDLKAACQNSTYLISMGKIEELFDILIQEDTYLHLVILDLLEKNNKLVEKHLKEGFLNLGSYLFEKDGDVLKIEISEVDIINTFITYVVDDVAEISINVEFFYEADVEYKDYENAVFDKEEHDYLFLDYIEETVSNNIDLDAIIRIQFSKTDPEYFKIIDISVNNGDDIWIESENWYS